MSRVEVGSGYVVASPEQTSHTTPDDDREAGQRHEQSTSRGVLLEWFDDSGHLKPTTWQLALPGRDPWPGSSWTQGVDAS